MQLTDYMLWMIGMAIATIAILTLGTLAAADMLHRPASRQRAARRPASSAATSEAHREPSEQRPVGAERDEVDLVDALTPLGSSLYAGVRLNSENRADQDRDRPVRPTA